MGIKSPFAWFGGKSRAVSIVWPRFGNVPNYVEPFFGSGAMLLGRPESHTNTLETINDLDCYLANFWRAVAKEPFLVAEYADRPVNEADLHALHYYLTRIDRKEFKEKMFTDPTFYDVVLAGWWIWGVNAWIMPEFAVKVYPDNKRPPRAKPYLTGTGQGIHAKSNRGIHPWFHALWERLRNVRVMCGDWERAVTHSVTTQNGLTGIFLDPPYDAYDRMYVDSVGISGAVREWAMQHGDNPNLRIALCGYEGEHPMPDGWECVEWRAGGGHANRNDLREAGNVNFGGTRERIWFSPHCLKPETGATLISMFGADHAQPVR